MLRHRVVVSYEAEADGVSAESRGARPCSPRSRPRSLRWRAPRAPSLSRSEDLARAARLLVVRSRREATGLFAGNYVSAFRGSGLEFEESRPVRARRRRAHDRLERHRAPRRDLREALPRGARPDAAVRARLLGVDALRQRARSKAGTAAHALALLAAAASRAGDRVGLVAFDERLRAVIPPARGVAHGRRVVETALACAAARRRRHADRRRAAGAARRRRAAACWSCSRTSATSARCRTRALRRNETLSELARRHDLVAGRSC